ncbi:MAG: hypothetical protein INR73_28545 [Williamsia sp.]|nr:hypothetical protein [Williamsia sp.]
MSYTEGIPLPVFLNGDLQNSIGWCRIIDDEDIRFTHAHLILLGEVSHELFVHYLREAAVKDCFEFAGLHLLARTPRKPAGNRKVIQMPRLEAGKQKRAKRLKEIVM